MIEFRFCSTFDFWSVYPSFHSPSPHVSVSSCKLCRLYLWSGFRINTLRYLSINQRVFSPSTSVWKRPLSSWSLPGAELGDWQPCKCDLWLSFDFLMCLRSTVFWLCIALRASSVMVLLRFASPEIAPLRFASFFILLALEWASVLLWFLVRSSCDRYLLWEWVLFVLVFVRVSDLSSFCLQSPITSNPHSCPLSELSPWTDTDFFVP
jgi:hypothetical protein